jgi:hypothetical protein
MASGHLYRRRAWSFLDGTCDGGNSSSLRAVKGRDCARNSVSPSGAFPVYDPMSRIR